MNVSHFPLPEAPHRLARTARVAYAFVFAIALPLLLRGWALALDRNVRLPRVVELPGALFLLVTGACVMLAGVVALRVRGGGWPMSPFPPARLVVSSIYAIVAHPLYVGAVLFSAGCFGAIGSAAGVWIVTPVLAAACIAWVWGFEQQLTDGLFGRRAEPPVLHIPGASLAAASRGDRLSLYVLAFLPWYLAYEGINRLPLPSDALSLLIPADARIPVIGWTELIYFSTYVLVLVAPLVAKSALELRTLLFRTWFATAAASICYLALPTVLPKKPVPPSLFAPLLEWERSWYAPNTALPAFHVTWTMLVAPIFARAFPRWSLLAWLAIPLTAISCLTTGMHAIADVVAGLALGAVVLVLERLWAAIVRSSEALANGWREVRVGPVRLINHGIFGAMAAGCGLLLVAGFAGGQHVNEALVIAVTSIVGAALWAQFVEGSPALLRPYGYYGCVAGALLAIALLTIMGRNGWLLLAAFTTAAPFIQAIGRMRCMIQGCCHGRPVGSAHGIVVNHPMSRIVRLAQLGGIPLHPTPLYSSLGNLAIGVLLVRMWVAHAPLSLVAGAYFVLSGLARFVEEHYRGEPQTRVFGGLRMYQWLAIVSVAGGALLTCFASPVSPGWHGLDAITWLDAAAFAVFAYCAYGLDFPSSTRRFSRLA